MEFSEAKAGHFYIVLVRTYLGRQYDSITPVIKCVAKCTQVQDFMKGTGYINVHFKCASGYRSGGAGVYGIGERLVTYGSRFKFDNHDAGIELIEEVTDDRLKDTSIIFIDDKHYKKLVNKGVYKEFEL